MKYFLEYLFLFFTLLMLILIMHLNNHLSLNYRKYDFNLHFSYYFKDKLSFNLMANNKNGLARSQSVNSKRVVKFNYNKVDPEVVKRKTKSALELNRAKKLEEDSLEVYVFEEKRLYDNYLNLCQERDKIPRSLPQRIDVLKKRDPIFAKRYRQFLSAKTCNKAPKFDPRDNLLPMKLPKLTIQREKEKIIKLVQKKPYQKPDYFKIELERINERVKTFVKDFDTQLVF